MSEPIDGLTAGTLTLLILGPLIVALVAILVPRRRIIDVAAMVLGTLLLVLLVPLSHALLAGGPLFMNLGGHRAPIAIVLYVDSLALGMLWLMTLLALAVHAYAGVWLNRREHVHGHDYRVLWLVLWTGLNSLILSGDLFNLYVMLEVTTLGAVSLVMLGGSARAVSAAARYLFFALVGSVLFLLGTALVYAEIGLLHMPMIALRADDSPAIVVALLTITVGVAMKAALFPLHAWLPIAHASAPTPASAVLSAAVATAGVYLLLRLWLGPFAGTWTVATAQGIGAIGAAGIVYGSAQALRQQRIKVIVAYSTVAQLGYLLLLVPLAQSTFAWQGAIYHAVTHGLAKAGIFLAVGNLILAIGNDRLENLPGADQFAAKNVLVIGMAGAAIAGLPPTGGFLAKWWLLGAALEQGQWWWVAVIALGSLLAAAYMFRILHYALRKPENRAEADERTAEKHLPHALLWPPALLALAVIGLGFAGDTVAPFLQVIGTFSAGTGAGG